jgi:hypothetical protein
VSCTDRGGHDAQPNAHPPQWRNPGVLFHVTILVSSLSNHTGGGGAACARGRRAPCGLAYTEREDLVCGAPPLSLGGGDTEWAIAGRRTRRAGVVARPNGSGASVAT